MSAEDAEIALEEAKRILVASLRDPDQVVLDPDHAWEEADGSRGREGSPRACLVKLEWRAAIHVW